VGETPLLRGQVRAEQQLGHSEHAVQRRAELMAHTRQELALGPTGGLGDCAGPVELNSPSRQLPRLGIGHVLGLPQFGERGLLSPFGGFESRPHFVDALRELSHRVSVGGVDPVREVALTELTGGAQDELEMATEHPTEQNAHSQAREGRHHHGDSQRPRAVLRRPQDLSIRRLDEFGGPVSVVGRPVHRVVDQRVDVGHRTGRSLPGRIGTRVGEGIEGPTEPFLLGLQPHHTLELGSVEGQRLELGEDAADRVEVLPERGKLLAQGVLLPVPIEVRPEHREPERHLREVALLLLLDLDLALDLHHDVAETHDREHGTQERD
jgi:hypothetical protein